MKLPLPFLLYTTSLGLVGFTGWQVYELLPLQKRDTKNAAITAGQQIAKDRMTLGKTQGPVSTDWFYTGWVRGQDKTGNRWWWKQLQDTNFIGKPPPPPPVEPGEETGPKEVPPPPVVPLENIIELSLLTADGEDGTGAMSHVVLQYKPEANVVPPEWYVREMQTSPAAGTPAWGGPKDGAPPPRQGGNPTGPRGTRGVRGARASRGANAQGTPMPVAQGGPGALLQSVWVHGGDDPRHAPNLWPPYEHIRLVRVAPDAQSAFFVREAPPPKEGAEPVEPEEEQLFKTAANLPQDVLRALSELDGKERAGAAGGPAAPVAAVNDWRDTAETEVVGNRWNVARKDQERFESEEDFLEKVYFDTYVSKVSNRRGLVVRNVDPQLASKFGVGQGDVLLSVNGRQVRTKAEAIQFGKDEYKKGVRTFITVWLSGGQEVERVYQLPDK